MIMVGEEDRGLERKIRAYNRQVFEEFDDDRKRTERGDRLCRRKHILFSTFPAMNTSSDIHSDSADKGKRPNWKNIARSILIVALAPLIGLIGVPMLRLLWHKVFDLPFDGKSMAYAITTMDITLYSTVALLMSAIVIVLLRNERISSITLRIETILSALVLLLVLMRLLQVF